MQKLPIFFLVVLLLPTMAMAETLCKVNANNTFANCDTGAKVTVNPLLQLQTWAQNNVGLAVILGIFIVAILIVIGDWLSNSKNQVLERIFIILVIILVIAMLIYLFWG